MIHLGQTHLRHAINEYVAYYNEERNYQALDNELIDGKVLEFDPRSEVKRCKRPGGLSNYYYCEAA